MFKLAGACFVIVFATLAGLQKATFYAQRPRQLRQLRIALQLLETEIVYGSTPLVVAMEHIARRVKKPVASLFTETAQHLRDGEGTSLEECWTLAIQTTWAQTALKEDEKEILLQFGQMLGLTDKQDQRKHIKLAVGNLQSEEEHAKMLQQRYEKMCKTLGFMSGLLLVILMY